MKGCFIFLMITGTTVYSQQYSPVLEDNSFFIEEAYNQEEGVVQHIFKGEFLETKDIAFIFTEEIPVVNEIHQFSFELAYLLLKQPERNGIGDLIFQYRYQLYDKKDWAAVAPAFSIVVPSGMRIEEGGSAAVGYKVLIPVSKRVSEHFTVHLNAGVLHFPDAEISSTEFLGGGSIIWLPLANLNFHFEYLLTSLSAEGNSSSEHLFIPGVRYGINIGSLQIVPALAAPFNTTRDTKESIILYLSFEHPL